MSWRVDIITKLCIPWLLSYYITFRNITPCVGVNRLIPPACVVMQWAARVVTTQAGNRERLEEDRSDIPAFLV